MIKSGRSFFNSDIASFDEAFSIRRVRIFFDFEKAATGGSAIFLPLPIPSLRVDL